MIGGIVGGGETIGVVTEPEPPPPPPPAGGGLAGGGGGGGVAEGPGKYKNPDLSVLLLPEDCPIAGCAKELHNWKLADDPYPPPPLCTGSFTMKFVEE